MLPKSKNEADPETQIKSLQFEPKKTVHESEIENPFSTKDEIGSKRSKSEGESGSESHERVIAATWCDSSIEHSTSATAAAAAATEIEENSSGRERLKRHRAEVAGRVWIPEVWGQENLLKDWIDCTAFDAALMNSSIMSARASLVEEGRRASNSRFRIQNSC